MKNVMKRISIDYNLIKYTFFKEMNSTYREVDRFLGPIDSNRFWSMRTQVLDMQMRIALMNDT